MTRLRSRLLIGPALLALACLNPTAAPAGAQPYQTPAYYDQLWQANENCSGVQADLAAVRFFAVPDTPFHCGNRLCAGLWIPKHDVYIGEYYANPAGWLVIRHEMLHDMLQRADHPPVFAQCGLLFTGPDSVGPL